jgi:hypothetical protein
MKRGLRFISIIGLMFVFEGAALFFLVAKVRKMLASRMPPE